MLENLVSGSHKCIVILLLLLYIVDGVIYHQTSSTYKVTTGNAFECVAYRCELGEFFGRISCNLSIVTAATTMCAVWVDTARRIPEGIS